MIINFATSLHFMYNFVCSIADKLFMVGLYFKHIVE